MYTLLQAHYDARGRNAADPGYEPATTTTPMQSPADVPSSAPPQPQVPLGIRTPVQYPLYGTGVNRLLCCSMLHW